MGLAAKRYYLRLTISLETYRRGHQLDLGNQLDLDRSFGFLVNDVARLFGRRFDHNGKRLGLTRTQCRTLGYIARNEGINQAGLADLLEIRPMTLVRQIDRMEEAGWIERRPHPADRRARRLFLTAKARPILGRIWRVATETRDEALARLAPREAEQLIDLLHRVHATMSERLAGDGTRRAAMPVPRLSRSALIAETVGDPLPAVEVGQ
jgi:MarR family transcriptional regulator for hemolysin